MNRQRIVGADLLQQPMRRPAVAHEVLGMDLEEVDTPRPTENVLDTRRHPGHRRKIAVRSTATRFHVFPPCPLD